MKRYDTAASRAFVLAMLLIVYTFNFLDRLVMSILATPIKAELHLTDAQLGMLGGLAFAILYSVLAIPFAWLADRTRRSWVISASLLVWSGFTALCGMTTSFGALLARPLRSCCTSSCPSSSLACDWMTKERWVAMTVLGSTTV